VGGAEGAAAVAAVVAAAGDAEPAALRRSGRLVNSHQQWVIRNYG